MAGIIEQNERRSMKEVLKCMITVTNVHAESIAMEDCICQDEEKKMLLMILHVARNAHEAQNERKNSVAATLKMSVTW